MARVGKVKGASSDRSLATLCTSRDAWAEWVAYCAARLADPEVVGRRRDHWRAMARKSGEAHEHALWRLDHYQEYGQVREWGLS